MHIDAITRVPRLAIVFAYMYISRILRPLEIASRRVGRRQRQ